MSREECHIALLGILIHDVLIRANHLPSTHMHSMKCAMRYVDTHPPDKVESTIHKLFAAYLQYKLADFPLHGLTNQERHTIYAYSLLEKFVQVTA